MSPPRVEPIAHSPYVRPKDYGGCFPKQQTRPEDSGRGLRSDGSKFVFLSWHGTGCECYLVHELAFSSVEHQEDLSKLEDNTI